MGRLEEIAVIVFLGLIFFSPNKLLDIAKSLGSSLHEFKKAINPEAQPAQATAVQPAPSRASRARKATVAKKIGKAKRT